MRYDPLLECQCVNSSVYIDYHLSRVVAATTMTNPYIARGYRIGRLRVFHQLVPTTSANVATSNNYIPKEGWRQAGRP